MCLVLAGSVVEAMLVDLLEQDSAMYEAARAGLNASLPQGKKKVTGPPADLDFFQLIEVAGPGGLKRLADRTCKAAHLLRDTRNFVHPTREREETKGQLLRSQEEALAAALVEMVLADLAPRSTA